MMMTVDEKLHAYAKNQKDRNIDEEKITTDHYKIERSILGWRNRKKYVMVRIFISASFVYTEALVVCSRGSITNPLDDNVLIRQ